MYKGMKKVFKGMKKNSKVWKKISRYEIVFEGMKKYLLGMKKKQFLQISHFIPEGMKKIAVFSWCNRCEAEQQEAEERAGCDGQAEDKHQLLGDATLWTEVVWEVTADSRIHETPGDAGIGFFDPIALLFSTPESRVGPGPRVEPQDAGLTWKDQIAADISCYRAGVQQHHGASRWCTGSEFTPELGTVCARRISDTDRFSQLLYQ